MKLQQHINENHGGSNSKFAASVTTKDRLITSSQVARWIKQGCEWINNSVYQNKIKG